jgi:hypothetical protein
MLLVVFGAGASYDSVLQLPPPPPEWITTTSTRRVQQYGVHEEFRHPLANQLFDESTAIRHVDAEIFSLSAAS